MTIFRYFEGDEVSLVKIIGFFFWRIQEKGEKDNMYFV